MAFFKTLSVIFSAKCHFPASNFFGKGGARTSPKLPSFFNPGYAPWQKKPPKCSFSGNTLRAHGGRDALKILFPQKPPLTVLLYGIAGSHKAISGQFIFPVVNAQDGLELLKGNEGMQRLFLLYHASRVCPRIDKAILPFCRILGILAFFDLKGNVTFQRFIKKYYTGFKYQGLFSGFVFFPLSSSSKAFSKSKSITIFVFRIIFDKSCAIVL